MFILDRRSVQQRLVEDMKDGQVPLKHNCAMNTVGNAKCIAFFAVDAIL